MTSIRVLSKRVGVLQYNFLIWVACPHGFKWHSRNWHHNGLDSQAISTIVTYSSRDVRFCPGVSCVYYWHNWIPEVSTRLGCIGSGPENWRFVTKVMIDICRNINGAAQWELVPDDRTRNGRLNRHQLQRFYNVCSKNTWQWSTERELYSKWPNN